VAYWISVSLTKRDLVARRGLSLACGSPSDIGLAA
jgi:hypothetical protein